jgi:hypothetical protein
MLRKDRERHVDERDANDVETRFVCYLLGIGNLQNRSVSFQNSHVLI